jgi:hypothetical protein
MKLIAEKAAKADKYDNLRYVRADGSESRSPMPRQGTLPHDLIHYVVETTLPLEHGFLSLVAKGADALFVMETVHDRTNPAVETEAVQAEAVVEALQAQLWSGTFDTEAFLEGARLACVARDKPTFDFAAIDPKILYDRALELFERWQRVPFYQSIELDFALRT